MREVRALPGEASDREREADAVEALGCREPGSEQRLGVFGIRVGASQQRLELFG